jgi:hypothetical protein
MIADGATFAVAARTEFGAALMIVTPPYPATVDTPQPPTPVPVEPAPVRCPFKPASVVVDTFTLTAFNRIADGEVFTFHDGANPNGARVRAWVVNGALFLSLDYPGACPNLAGQTGLRRIVR